MALLFGILYLGVGGRALHMEAASALISLSPWEGTSVTLLSPPWTEGSSIQKGQPRAEWCLNWGLASLSAHC